MGTIVNKPFELEVAERNVNSYIEIDKFAENFAISTSWQDIWVAGGDYTYLTAAQPLKIFSNSLEDSTTGSGVFQVHVFGLDENFDLIDEIVTLSGTTVVVTSQSFIRTYRARGIRGGGHGENVGSIFFQDNAGSVLQAEIISGAQNSSFMSQFTIPRGFVGFFRELYASANKGDETEVRLMVRPPGCLFRVKRQFITFQQRVETDIGYFGDGISEKTDIKMRARRLTGNAAAVLGGYELILKKITYT